MDDLARDSHGRFAVGNAGGPGRPRGAVGAAAAALDRAAAEAQVELMRVVLDQARAGNLEATRMLWSRIWPARRGRPLAVQVPAVLEETDVAPAQAAVAAAVLNGEITADEAKPVLEVIKAQKAAICSENVRRDFEEIEARLASETEGEAE
ncbi:MAG: hypothetical protein JOY81_10595 [Alphaproteobacteria bacterium]|nr:hypothetical protein [Alphaproteobacteria bacterium]